jgi:hypothetical protein
MKTQMKHIITLFCIFVLCAGLTVPAGATNINDIISIQSSDFLTYYAAYALSRSGGEVIIEFEVDGTGRMDLVGSSYIVIQEKSGSTWKGVSTYFGSVSNGMLDDNAFSHIGSITYAGTLGKEYRALVTIYAEGSAGDDSRTVTTNTVTAR